MPFVGGSLTRITNQDGGRPPSWKNRKIVISQPRFERFWRNLARWCSLTLLTVPTVKNLKFQKFKSKMAAAAILKNRKIAIAQLRFERFRRNLAWWRSRPSWLFGPLQRSKEIQDAGGRHLNKLKITISRQWFEQPSDFSVFTYNIFKQYMYITTSTEKRIRYFVTMRTIQYGLVNSAMGQIPCSTERISCLK